MKAPVKKMDDQSQYDPIQKVPAVKRQQDRGLLELLVDILQDHAPNFKARHPVAARTFH